MSEYSLTVAMNTTGTKQRNLPAQITVYAALSLFLVVSLFCTCIKAAKAAGMYVDVDMAAVLSVESVFAGYSDELLSEFNVFALNTGDEEFSASAVFDYYSEKNINGICSKNDVEYVSSELSDVLYMTDNCGEGLEVQVLEYMKKDSIAQLAESLMGMAEEYENSGKVSQLTERILSCQNETFDIDEIMLELLENTEGIKTNQNGLVIRNGEPVSTGEYFAKALINGEVTMSNTSIDNDNVYKALSGKGSRYVNGDGLVDDMLEAVRLYRENGDRQYAKDYSNKRKDLEKAVNGVLIKTNGSLEILDKYEGIKAECIDKLEECKKSVLKEQEYLNEAAYRGFEEDLSAIERECVSDNKKLCNLSELRSGLNENKIILQQLKNSVSELSKVLDEDAAEQDYQLLQECSSLINCLSNEKIHFDYSLISFKDEFEGTGVIESLKKLMKDGICGFVLADKDVSDNSIKYNDLASNYIADAKNTGSVKSELEKSHQGLTLEQLTKKAIFNEYLLEKLKCYTDKTADDKSWCELEYPLEYIICGKNCDSDNITEIILKLSVIREGINMAYIITDSAKKGEALSLAASLVGFTGNMAVVKLAEYLILAAWAYGESICDIRALFDGEAISLIKTQKDWKLSLEGLLNCDFTKEGSQSDKSKTEAESGDKTGKMNYKDYLRLLLFMENTIDRNFRTMDIIELRMMSIGQKDFRMKNHIWSASGVITVRFLNKKQYYLKEIAYSYK